MSKKEVALITGGGTGIGIDRHHRETNNTHRATTSRSLSERG